MVKNMGLTVVVNDSAWNRSHREDSIRRVYAKAKKELRELGNEKPSKYVIKPRPAEQEEGIEKLEELLDPNFINWPEPKTKPKKRVKALEKIKMVELTVAQVERINRRLWGI